MPPRLFAALTLAALAAAANAQEFPKLKPGLWNSTTTTVGRAKQEQRPSMLCLDESVQQDMYRMSMGMMFGLCSKHDVKIAGNKITIDAVCDLGVTKMVTNSVMTFTGNTSYRTEARATFDPPLKNTPRESLTIIEGRHVGDCKPGQQPGDMTLPNGQNMNIRQWMAPKG